jgi:hypothetical protein
VHCYQAFPCYRPSLFCLEKGYPDFVQSVVVNRNVDSLLPM